MRARTRALGGYPGDVTVAGIPLDDALVGQVEPLLSVRTRDLALPRNLLNLFGAATYRARARVMIELDFGIVALNLFSLAFDWITLATDVEVVLAISRIVVSLVYLGAIVGLRSSWGCGREGLLVLVPAVTMVAFAGVCGLFGGPVLLERLLLNALFAIGATVILASVRPRDTMLLVALAVMMLAGFMSASPGHATAETMQMVGFYGVGLMALAHARLTANRIQQRLFVLDLGARIKVREVSMLNARLYAAARTDPLTGIGNRRSFDEAFEAARAGGTEPISVIMIDIDHFKKLNDVLGHSQGDACLRVVAAALKDALRDERDIVARFGGEEFVVVLSGESLADATKAADRLRTRIHDLDLPHPGSPLRRVTVSIGVASTPLAPVEQLVTCADEALYQAKQLGRDRVVVYEALAWDDAPEVSAA